MIIEGAYYVGWCGPWWGNRVEVGIPKKDIYSDLYLIGCIYFAEEDLTRLHILDVYLLFGDVCLK